MVAILPGCHCPGWESRSEARLTHAHKVWSDYKEYDAAGRDRLERMSARIERGLEARDEKLQRNANRLVKAYESRTQNWYADRPYRRAFAWRQWCGKPEKRCPTWEKMVY